VALQILLNDTYKLNHCKEMGAKLGRRFLKQPAEKLKAVFVAPSRLLRIVSTDFLPCVCFASVYAVLLF